MLYKIYKYFLKKFCSERAPELPSCILFTFLWYNKDILISNKPIYFKHFTYNNLNYVTRLFYNTRSTKEWGKLKYKFTFNNNLYFNWIQLIQSIPQKWKNIIKNNRMSTNFFCRYSIIIFFLNHHFT